MNKHLFSIIALTFAILFCNKFAFADPTIKISYTSTSFDALGSINATSTSLSTSYKCIVNSATITDVIYTVGSKSSSKLQNVVQPGKKVKVCFTVPRSTGISTYSLVSYKTPYATFVEDDAHLQEVYDSKTIDVDETGGNICLEIDVPNCFFQVDFVKGCVINELGPAGTDNFYGKQKRLIAFAHGGNVSCAPPDAEGCTPGYWKNHTDRWVSNTTTDYFFTVFGINSNYYQGLEGNMTLAEALNLGGGNFHSLARHATAALLSAENPDVKYTYTTSQIINMVKNAFELGRVEAVKALLEAANEKDCPLGGTPATTPDSGDDKAKEKSKGKNLIAYPTPFKDKATIEFTLTKPESYTIKLFDMRGKLVRQLKADTAKVGEINNVEIDGNTLVEGLYLVRLVSESQALTVKILLKR